MEALTEVMLFGIASDSVTVLCYSLGRVSNELLFCDPLGAASRYFGALLLAREVLDSVHLENGFQCGNVLIGMYIELLVVVTICS